MQSYTLYNDDVACANFVYANGLIRECCGWTHAPLT